jgi:ribonuclease D
LLHKLGIQLAAAIELDQIVRRLGYRQAVGLKAAVAIVLGRRLQKSRKMTTSNWALPTLSPGQLQYAADDAHASLAVYLALGCPAPAAPAGAGPLGQRHASL